MSTNDTLADRLQEVAQLLEVLGEDSFRANAHTRAARAVGALTTDVRELAKDRAALLKVEGIGPKLADKIIEFCASGTMKELEDLRAQVPAGLLSVLALPGVGPKTVHAMWKTLGITSVAGLSRAIDDGSLLTLPRMGEKAVEKIRQAIALAAQGEGRLRLGPAWALAQRIEGVLRRVPGVAQVQACGSLRRGRETVGDLDFVVAMLEKHAKDAPSVMHAFTTMAGVASIIVQGDAKSSVRCTLDGEEPASDGRSRTVQCDLRVVPLSSFGSAVQYFTGSKEHNVRLRTLAQQRGLTLNEWGLFEESAWRTYHDHPRGATMPKPVVSCETEASIYAHLRVPCVPPELREDHGELEHGAPEHLIGQSNIVCELHAHTTASDGVLSIEELARAAHARGFHTIAVTDHSQSSTIARGLRPDRMQQHIRAVREAAKKLHETLGIRVLIGSEVDILADGSLDYDDSILEQLDVVVASPHASLSQDDATATKRLLRAITHPRVHILGHPTGRLILSRKGLEPNMDELTSAAKEHHVALEVNAHWMRLDLRDTHIRLALSKGCDIAINCDVHHPEDFDNLRFGVMTARRAGLTKDRCVNAWSQAAVEAWLQRKHAK